jgi:hypothetical protein
MSTQHNTLQQEYQKEREQMFAQHEQTRNKRKRKFIFIGLGVLLVLVFGSGVWAYSHFLTPGPYDHFAKCLTGKGAVMYGAIEWCKYTQGQANMFGKSFKYVNYKDEVELEGIRTRPTWVINGKWYEKVQSFESLAAATGCTIG